MAERHPAFDFANRAWNVVLRKLSTTTLSVVLFAVIIPLLAVVISVLYDWKHAESPVTFGTLLRHSAIPTLITIAVTGAALLGLFGWGAISTLGRDYAELAEFRDRVKNPKPERKPLLIWNAFQFIKVTFDKDARIWREQWSEYSSQAFVFHFTNSTYEDGKGVPATNLRAQIKWQYSNGSEGPTFSPTAWVDEPCGSVDIPVAWSKKLIIGVKCQNYWDGYTNFRIKADDKHQLDGQPVPYHGTFVLKLVGDTDEVWYEHKWEWVEDLVHGSHPSIRLIA